VGSHVDDRYAWLTHESEETSDWEARQDEAARRALEEWSGMARLREQVARADVATRLFAPVRSGDRWFRLIVHEGLAGPVLHVADRPGDRGRVLIDPGDQTLDWSYPSPDGRLVAYGLSERGSEQSVLHLVDVETGRVLPERIPHTSFGVVAWLPDSTGFYYNGSLGPDTEQPQKHIFFHRIGDEPPTTPEPAIFRDDEDFIYPQISEDGRWVVAISSEAEPRPDSILDRTSGVWQPFLIDLPTIVNGSVLGDRYVAVTTDAAPTGRLVAIPLATPMDRSTWTELRPAGDGVMRSVTPVGDVLVVEELIDTSSRLLVLGRDGTHHATVPPTPPGSVSLTTHLYRQPIDPPIAPDGDGFVFIWSTWDAGAAISRYDIGRGTVSVIEQAEPPAFPVDASLLDAGAPGAPRATAWVVRRADRPDGPGPTLVYGYGGWNIAFGHPAGLGAFGPFVEAGGTMVFAHLPGGGEYGMDHWLAGFRERKQGSYDALYAIVERLIADGIAAPDRVAVVGTSNGGLLAAVALTQRPDLFAAAVSLVPITDMLDYTRDPYTAEFALEYGDPRDPVAAAWLGAYSPVHAIRDGVRYPATLVICGDSDVRCPAWHGRVFTAKLQDATAGESEVLYRLRRDSGHLTSVQREMHEWLGFVMEHLGVDP
jgi:prolyl oligopeptidase